jgi:two-component system OmpR family response regulator
MESYKILMADDERDVLDIMAKKVAMQGYEVVKAYDGDEAWRLAQYETPDVLVLDINMPGLDGFEVLKNIREKPTSTKWQPVIIVSARTELDDMKKSYTLEADHYITKPCNVDDIVKAVKLMISLIPQRQASQN